MPAEKRSRPLTLYVLSLCILFSAINALGGGFVLLSDVSGGAMQLPLDWLKGSPFANYFIPGLFLFVVFGVGGLIVLYALWGRPDVPVLSGLSRLTHRHWAWTATLMLGLTLVLWILIQIVVIQQLHPLQFVMGTLGIVIALLDLLPDIRRFYQR